MHSIAYIVALPVIAILVPTALVRAFRHLLPLPEPKPWSAISRSSTHRSVV